MKNTIFAGLISAILAGVAFAGTAFYLLRLEAYGGWFSAAGDPLTVLPALGFVFLAVAVPLFLVGAGKSTVPLFKGRVFVPIPALGFLATLATGGIWTGAVYTPGGVAWKNYGFPLAWRVDVIVSCPPFCNQGSGPVYNPPFFALDLIFYAAIGYAILLLYGRMTHRTEATVSHQVVQPAVS